MMSVAAAGPVVIAAAPAGADPVPAPPAPDVTTYVPVNPADYTVNAGKWYAFAGPPGVVCVLDSLKGDYGCAGPLPGAPAGVNLVSAGPAGVPAFATETAPYAAAGAVRPLPPNTRLSFRQIFCGVDDTGTVTCLNTREGSGFIVGPQSSSIIVPPPPPPPPAPAPDPAAPDPATAPAP